MASHPTEAAHAPTPTHDNHDDVKRGPELVADAPPRSPPKKRRRLVISCTECHRRKQKCDRQLPCANCVTRNKATSCRYEEGAPTTKEKPSRGSNNGVVTLSSTKQELVAVESIPLPTKSADFGYSQTGASTLGFLRTIDGANPAEPLSQLAQDAATDAEAQHRDHLNTRERYRSLIRQLPARTFIDRLVDIYFQDFNWTYYALDRDIFDKQLAEWHSLPFNLLTNGGPQALSPDLRAFPAMLFQVLATSLLFLPKGPHPTFDSLKYAGNMTFEDLAVDYSESGVAILSLLGKRQMSLTTVLGGFLRAAFLKYGALVTEAWHAIGSAIRDGQEIGLHRESLDPKPTSNDAEAVLENQWEIQRRRKVWVILVSWDVHTAVVLGRPTTVNLNLTPPIVPVDAPIPKDRRKTPIRPRGEHDPPTPLTRTIWGYYLLSQLRDILDLEKEGPCPKDFSKIDKIHERLLEMQDQTPAYFRVENPDTRFDALPECHWIPYARALLPQVISFNIMALHRPYIFTRPKSRTQALRASLDVLEAQKLYFEAIDPQQYRTYALFFGTFDAIVLMASIFILFPKEQPELVQAAMQHLQWGLERFEAMSDRNALARAALGVLRAIRIRLRKSLGLVTAHGEPMTNDDTTTSKETPFSSNRASSPRRQSSVRAPTRGGSISASTASSALVSEGFSESVAANDFDWSLPSDFDWSTIQPIFATGDLVYNDLICMPDEDGPVTTQWGEGSDSMPPAAQPWQFEGGFGNDSVWNLLNHYTPL